MYLKWYRLWYGRTNLAAVFPIMNSWNRNKPGALSQKDLPYSWSSLLQGRKRLWGILTLREINLSCRYWTPIWLEATLNSLNSIHQGISLYKQWTPNWFAIMDLSIFNHKRAHYINILIKESRAANIHKWIQISRNLYPISYAKQNFWIAFNCTY